MKNRRPMGKSEVGTVKGGMPKKMKKKPMMATPVKQTRRGLRKSGPTKVIK